MAILTAGIDLGRNVLAVDDVNEMRAAQLRRPKVALSKLEAVIAALPSCMIGIEVRSGARTTGRDSSRPMATPCG